MSVPAPTLGPCQSWATVDDVTACCTDVDPDAAEEMAVEASMLLFEISGRRYNGICDRKVRPCQAHCGCWGSMSGIGPWQWVGMGAAWAWRDDRGRSCGCTPLSRVRLDGYPIREIVEVKIDGAVLPALDDDGNPNYRVDYWTDLIRMDDPVTGQARRWPGCQNLALTDEHPGTFSVTYRWGVDPPALGAQAAAQLACELLKSCGSLAECKLPAGATRVTRQGVTVERQLVREWLASGKSGLFRLDSFIQGYGNQGRATAIFSPDIPSYAQPEGF